MAQTRRNLLGSALVALPLLPTAAVLASASTPDPVFALLEQEQAAWDAFHEAIDRFTEAETAVCNCPDDDPRWPAFDQLETLAGKAESAASDAAEDALCACLGAATTPAGFLAAFKRFMARERDFLSAPLDEMVEALLENAQALFGTNGGEAS